MYALKLLDASPYEWEGNRVFEPITLDMTHGLVVQCLEVRQPTPLHSHLNIEQVYIIRSGRGLMRVNDEIMPVDPETVIYVPPGAEHCLAPVEGEQNLTYITLTHHYHETGPTRTE